MLAVAVAGVGAVLAVEVPLVAAGRYSAAVLVAGAVTALVLFEIRRRMAPVDVDDQPPGMEAERAEATARWMARTESLISWADGTRGDWDHHLRPLLAREFQQSTGRRQGLDAADTAAAGEVFFGDLWQWVDPECVQRSDRAAPGPGRDVLDRILQRLEQL
ncbi:hypothetical protein [Rhodococcus opacus]|uniref:Uncharacterized protein n=1 Tax=Rhodococcus opacus TaxID=37919 RepID=A0AAX3YFX7_RHOOP|nr:hypothetical protein [Rhodococcus opacus]NHU45036.1 hypothetical protein [Rhodococcus sp. A14]MBA8958373.1 hypothetical protein [Rhodococcus opacus]MBP2203938.1 hypothetical protein [Rhodococcus opacus]MCZ4589868.1 hypothetical protein [Rhodococcus opacus]WLF48208.1 hypothetical protein Q5707_04170 [Rhodococcus opacus]